MASDSTVLNVIGRALWDPNPTRTDTQARQLAVALGYPASWRVVRTLEEVSISTQQQHQQQQRSEAAESDKPGSTSSETEVKQTSDSLSSDKGKTEPETIKEESSGKSEEEIAASGSKSADTTSNPTASSTNSTTQDTAVKTEDVPPTSTNTDNTADKDKAELEKSAEGSSSHAASAGCTSSSPYGENVKRNEIASETKAESVVEFKNADEIDAQIESTKDGDEKDAKEKQAEQVRQQPQQQRQDQKQISTRLCIVDRIYAGPLDTEPDIWYNHEAAMKAAANWVQGTSTPHGAKGGHRLPRQSVYRTGDKVQVLYEGEWWDAKILKVRQTKEGFRYQVYYTADKSRQAGVDEAIIRPVETAQGASGTASAEKARGDPLEAAQKLGFGEGWQAFSLPNNRYKIIAPDGTSYRSKKAAMEAFKAVSSGSATSNTKDSEGDPPWRTTGSEFVGRRVFWETLHKASATRTVSVEQVGTVTGWISESDVDKTGAPGFVSEKSGKPARLYHVVFDEDTSHPYASHLVASQDLEEDELIECLLPEDESKPKKRARKR